MSNKAHSATDRTQERAPVASSLYEAPPPQDPNGSATAPNHPAEGGSLDKLEKPCISPDEALREGVETMGKRARSKYLTSDLLADLEALDSPIPYERARGCCRHVLQEDRKLVSSFCGCRWCIVCNRIRMGRIINEYLPILKLWEEEKGVYFVSLTIPNVEGGCLRSRLEEMKQRLRYCRRSIRETRGFDYRAIENWEVTFNDDEGTFHPHVHVAVRGKDQALALREEWLKRWARANSSGQDVRKWDGSIGGMKELAKYATKMIAPGSEDRPPVEALDTIFRALYRKHLINPTGFDKDEERARAAARLEGVEIDPEATARPELDEEGDDLFEDLERCVPAYIRPEEGCIWTWDGADWWNEDTGEALTGHDPPASEAEPVESNT